MILAKVIGTLVSTQKNSYLVQHKHLIVKPVDLDLNPIGNKDMIALDFVDAGVNDIVLVTQEGDAAQQILGHRNAPVHTVIVAVVDKIDVES
ncbi:MAG: EutN/CcmL family microcompartment protein [Ignavibacteria bacterium]|jgi:ethanolamine utilization protein EutN|nr:EutN/CcmL family microcompartment protein [Ignavibacteria bacterium]MDH7528912.1 EutN/CcmL family microcompartment protein [Ignavibacteria bacterium]NPV11380.1 EutN/CcmL family microcompartment protein [Ignavibacteria bacterium]